MPKSPLLVLALLLVALVAPSSASASPIDLVADCNADGDLDRRYSATDYRAVLAQGSAELSYSGGCTTLFRQGLLTSRTIKVRRGKASIRIICPASGRGRLVLSRNGSTSLRCRANRTIRVSARVRRPSTKTRATVIVGRERTSFIISLKR